MTGGAGDSNHVTLAAGVAGARRQVGRRRRQPGRAGRAGAHMCEAFRRWIEIYLGNAGL